MEQATHKADKLATYVVIYVLLMLLLVATVIAGSIDLGVWNTVIALAIAVLKAILVVLFFMHVRHSSRMTWIFSGAAIVWLGFLIALTLTDYTTRDRPIPSSAAKITYPTIPASLSGDR
jgi:cytochrome c oxidase subunit 4